MEVVVEVASVGGHPLELPVHPRFETLDVPPCSAGYGDQRDIVVGEVQIRGVMVVRQKEQPSQPSSQPGPSMKC